MFHHAAENGKYVGRDSAVSNETFSPKGDELKLVIDIFIKWHKFKVVLTEIAQYPYQKTYGNISLSLLSPIYLWKYITLQKKLLGQNCPHSSKSRHKETWACLAHSSDKRQDL